MSTLVKPERRARALSGLPRPVDRSRGWFARAVRNPATYLYIMFLAFCVASYWWMYHLEHPDRQVPGGIAPGLNNDALLEAVRLAAPTAVVWLLVFMLLDRFRRQAAWMWALSFLWGACVATLVSMYLNSWAGALMMVRGDGDPSAGSRPAVFAAPFIEEASKATVIFLLAILIRYRIVSLLQSITLAGMSAIGFAFTENILYYARARVYASQTIQAGDADAAVHQLFLLRGVYTSFGHPLFTSMTAIGIAVAVRTRSKLVRILAPLTGFTVAAICHMAFNGTASTTPESQLKRYYLMALGIVLSVVLFVGGHVFRELRRIRARLDDFIRMGWLTARDKVVFSSGRRRLWLLIVAVRRGRRTLRATYTYMRDITELAYLRDAMVRGVVDEAGQTREKELLYELRAVRPMALVDTAGLRLDIPWRSLAFWRRRRAAVPAGGWAPPAGAAWGAPTGQPALRQ